MAITDYEQLEKLVKERKNAICISLAKSAKEHFSNHEKSFNVSVFMDDDGHISEHGDGDCVAYSHFSLSKYDDVYISDYEFELFAKHCDEYQEIKQALAESGTSFVSYVLRYARDGELYKLFEDLKYLKASEAYLRAIWNNENNGIWDYLNRKRAELSD